MAFGAFLNGGASIWWERGRHSRHEHGVEVDGGAVGLLGESFGLRETDKRFPVLSCSIVSEPSMVLGERAEVFGFDLAKGSTNDEKTWTEYTPAVG